MTWRTIPAAAPLALIVVGAIHAAQQPPGSPAGGASTAGVFAPVKDAHKRPITAGGFVDGAPIVFEDRTAGSGLETFRHRSGSPEKSSILDVPSGGVALIDFDNDGWLDVYLVNGSTRGALQGKEPAPRAALFHNNRNLTFTDVTDRAGVANGRWGFGIAAGDFDNDGWIDLYVTNHGPNRLYRNNHDGTFTDVAVPAGCAYSQDGKPQAGMGVAVGDYDRNGTMDVFKTNFAGDTSTLYANAGGRFCEDRTFASGIGINTRWLGWGTAFVDLDNDGWLDLFLTNGHVYPEVVQLKTEASYKQRKVVYRNLGNGRFADVTERLGAPATIAKAGRGAAFGDFDNDGQIDIAIANVNDTPDLFRLRSNPANHWVTLKLVGVRSNRDAIGARVHAVSGEAQQWQEVRGGGSYLSQNDFRVHFGLGSATRVDRVDVRWPNGLEESWENLGVDRFHTLKEGGGRVQGPSH